ncbi:hypothetical protein ACJX0J_013131 [Zea mays]
MKRGHIEAMKGKYFHDIFIWVMPSFMFQLFDRNGLAHGLSDGSMEDIKGIIQWFGISEIYISIQESATCDEMEGTKSFVIMAKLSIDHNKRDTLDFIHSHP